MSNDDLQSKLEAEREAMEACENEAIETIGTIQPFGYLLAADVSDRRISHVSANAPEWFGVDIQTLLGAPLETLLPRQVVHQANNALGHSTISTQRESVGRLQKYSDDTQWCDLFAHVKGQQLILELQHVGETDHSSLETLNQVQRILERLSTVKDENLLISQAVHELRAFTGFDRVKAYHFLSDGTGEVIAESRDAHIDSFLGLRFPAQDVPKSARKLYASTPIRIIPRVDAAQVNIVAADHVTEPLDLSLALFRGLVPVHSIYLRNMGVNGTLSLPIVIDGENWGLFAFHHMKERMLDSETLAATEILGNAISTYLNTILQSKRLARTEECTRIAGSLFSPAETALGFSAYWDTASSELATVIQCDGVGLLSASRYDQYGKCPSESTIRQLSQYLRQDFEDKFLAAAPIAIDSLASKYPDLELGGIAGILAIPDPALSYDFLFYFRTDASHLVRWAGNPAKNLEQGDAGFRLNPRASFEEYRTSVEKKSDPFEIEDMINAQTLRDALLRVMSSFSTQHQHRERLGLIVRELNHRVRNILALVQSIVHQSKGTADNFEGFIISLEQRLLSLSETQKLLTTFDWKPISFERLLTNSLRHVTETRPSSVRLVGEAISLPPEIASLFSLTINELASNATKYGALSVEAGTIEITWKIEKDRLIVNWTEHNGPPVTPPTRTGFGTALITEALTYEFDAQCELDYFATGVRARFDLPYKASDSVEEVPQHETVKHTTTPRRFTALVLEDDYIISKEMVRLLELLGAERVDTVSSIDSAKSCLEQHRYDVAYLDANIRGKFSGEVAQSLEDLKIAYFFVTGYGSEDRDLTSTNSLAILTKPVSKSQLSKSLTLANLHSND